MGSVVHLTGADLVNKEGCEVFAVYVSDCKYEGGSVAGVFSTIDKAREYALACVEDAKDEAEYSRRYRAAMGWKEDQRPWREEESDTWGDGMQVISIIGYTLDAPPEIRTFAEEKARRWAISPEDCAKGLP